MATPQANSAFQVDNLVDRAKTVCDFTNTMPTAAMFSDYDRFNGDATLGQSIRLPYPIKYNSVPDISITTGDINETFERYQTLSVGNVGTAGIEAEGEATSAFGMDAKQMTFYSGANSNDQFHSKYISPAVQSLGNAVNRSVFRQMELWMSDSIGDPTQDLDGVKTMLDINAQLTNMALLGCLGDEPAYFAMNPNSYATLQLPYAAVYFNEDVNFPILRKSTYNMQKLSGLAAYQDVDVITHTNGSAGPGVTVAIDVPLTTNINQTTTTVTVTGLTPSTAGVYNTGDLISFGTVDADQVNAVNPDNLVEYPRRKTFVVVSDDAGNPVVTSDGAGNAVLLVRSPIVASPTSSYRNVDRQVLTGMAVNLIGGANASYIKNQVWCRGGAFLANPPIADYPVSGVSSKDNQYSGLPNEMTASMKIPDSMLDVNVNISSQGDALTFENTWLTRAIWGSVAMNGFGFTVLSKVPGV